MATQTRVPTGVGAADTWTSSVPGNKWEDVDEGVATPDDDTTYIFKQDSAGTQRWTFTAFAITSSAVASVAVVHRTKRSAAGAVSTDGRITVNATEYNSADTVLTTSYADITDTWATNPDTGAAWTEADVEGIGANPLQNFAVRGIGLAAGEECRCTAIECVVDYTAVAGVAGFIIGGAVSGGCLIGQ